MDANGGETMKYKSIDIMEFPKTEEGWYYARLLEEKTRFTLTEKDDCLELRAENWSEVSESNRNK